MGVVFSYEKFQKVYHEISSRETVGNLLGVKMAMDGPVAVLINNHSYEELLTALTQLSEKVDKVANISNLIDELGENLRRIARVSTRRMW